VTTGAEGETATTSPRVARHGLTPRREERVPQRAERGWVMPALLWAVTLFALGVRLRHIGRANLWLDEVVGVMLARRTVPEILDNVSRSPHGPAYYLLLKGWTTIFGDGAGAARALSAAAGAVVVYLVFRIGARLAGDEPGATHGDARRVAPLAGLAALLTALSPVQLYFSQEARFHMVATAFSVAALAGYLRWRGHAVRLLLDEGEGSVDTPRVVRPDDLLRFVLPTALALYAYLLSALPLAACWLDVGLLLVARAPNPDARRAVAREWLLLQGAIVLCCVPLVLGRGDVGVASSTQSWRSALDVREALWELFYYPVHQFQSGFRWWSDMGDRWGSFHYGLGRKSGISDWLRVLSFPATFLVLVLAIIAALRVTLRGRDRRSPWRAVWLAALVPLVAVTVISTRQSLEPSRYALLAAPPLILLVARGLLAFGPRARFAAIAILVGTMARGALGQWRVDVRDTDYRSVAAVLARGARGGDSVVVSPSYLSPAVTYHVPSLAFEVRNRVGWGWSSAAFPGRSATGDWWLVLDYRTDTMFRAPADSLPAAEPFGGAALRVVMDTMLPSKIRVLKLVPR